MRFLLSSVAFFFIVIVLAGVGSLIVDSSDVVSDSVSVEGSDWSDLLFGPC